jgi:hypothetical protein
MISETFTDSSTAGTSAWNGMRAEVLSYSFGMSKGPLGRKMAEPHKAQTLPPHDGRKSYAPVPDRYCVKDKGPPIPSGQFPSERDDNPGAWPQHYRITEHAENSGDPLAEAQYTASHWLWEEVHEQFDAITVDRDHILLHHEIDTNHSGCPGSRVPDRRLMADRIAWRSSARL